MLSFKKEGVFILPPVSAKTLSGKTLESKPFKVRVTKQAVSKQYKPSKDDVVDMEVSLNKKHIKLGDSIECEIRLFTNMQITDMSSISPLLVSNAYWKEQDLPSEKTFEKVFHKGDSVNSVVWLKAFIRPIQSGRMVIQPMKFQAIIKRKDKEADPFEAFFGGGKIYFEIDTIIETKPMVVQVDYKQQPTRNVTIDTGTPTHRLGLVIDRSSSLLARSERDNDSFMQLENDFLHQLQEMQSLPDYSVTFFAGKPHYPTPHELSNIPNVMAFKENDGSAVYSSILASALRDGAITTNRSPYSILLLTDGHDNASRLSEKTLTNILLKHRIRVDVVVFACKKDSVFYPVNDSIEIIKIRNNQDYRDVERIAKATNGQFVVVDNRSKMPAAIRIIREKLLKSETPKQQPQKGFAPDKNLLYTFYKEIMSEASTGF